MSGPALPATPAAPAAPQEPGPAGRWRGIIGALVALLLVPVLPQARAIFPIEETMLLVIPAIAACAVIGWMRGGRMWLAVFWCGVAAWSLTRPIPGATVYADMVRGWALLAAGGFAAASAAAKQLRFLPRALLALLMAFAIGAAMNAVRDEGLGRVEAVVAARIDQRNAAGIAAMRAMLATSQGAWRDFVAARMVPGETERALESIARVGVKFFPAMLALETLAALALAYALYHRLGRTRIGEPLAKLREFRFNDQLVWGLIAGLTLAVLPAFVAMRGTGQNLLTFFGMLYGLRALAVLQWMWGSVAAWVWVALLALVLPAVGAVARALMLGLLLGIGVSDSWLDWRKRVAK